MKENARNLLTDEMLDSINGGQDYTKEWQEWTDAWKEWWIDHYGNVCCIRCGRRLEDSIRTYNKDKAYATYMNNAFLCPCGQVIKATESWK